MRWSESDGGISETLILPWLMLANEVVSPRRNCGSFSFFCSNSLEKQHYPNAPSASAIRLISSTRACRDF